MDDITKEAGVAKGTFYRYFDDKTQLVASILAPLVTELERASQRCHEAIEAATHADALLAAYGELARDLGAALLGAPDVARLYLQEHHGPDEGARGPIRSLAREIRETAVRLTETARRRKLLRPLPPRVTAVAVVGAVEALLGAALDGELQGDPVTVTDALIGMVLDGVRPR